MPSEASHAASAPPAGRSGVAVATALFAAVLALLYGSALYSYIVFHTLVEFVTIAIAFTLFTITWNTRELLAVGYLKIIGIGYGSIAVIDLLHTLSYKGLAVFPGYDANLPTQLWIAARLLQAILLCLAPLLSERATGARVPYLFGINLLIVAAVTCLIFLGGFPDCYLEGKGLTPFKIVTEYVICALLVAALYLFIRRRTAFNEDVFRLICTGILCTIGSELAFTAYVSVYAPANLFGHLLKLIAFYLIYRAIVVTGIKEPFQLIFRDFKQAEQALTREQEFSRHLLESMADGVVACDAEGILTLFNRTAREWHGLDPLRLPAEQWASRYDLFRADGVTPLPTEEIPLSRAFRGEAVTDARMAIKAGGMAPRLIVANGSVIRDASGAKLGAVVVMHDTTSLWHLEQELRNANEELERRVEERTTELRKANEQLQVELVERSRMEDALRRTAQDLNEAQGIARVGSWQLDLRTNRLTWSDEIYRIFEMDPEQFGASYEAFLQAVHPEDRDAVDFAYCESVRTRRPYTIDHRILFADNRIKYVHEQCETFYEDDQAVRSVGTVQDVTEQKQIEERLRRLSEELELRVEERTCDLEDKRKELVRSQQALMNIVEDLNLKTDELREANSRLQELDRLKSMFIASMSHELRTPLNSIIGFSSILHDEWLGPLSEEQRENLAIIVRSGRHLLNLINDVIDVSKIEAGKLDVHREEFDLQDLLSEALQYIGKEIQDKGLELHLEARDPIRLVTDRRRLLQCVINLLSNAVKFTEKGGITVRAGLGTAGVEIAVCDSGIGIAENDLRRLFKPFVRLDSALKPHPPGTGLGLYLTRKLAVEVLRGDVICSSVCGKGTTFTIRIPESMT